MDEVLTLQETAAYLKIPVATLRQWRYKGTGPVAYKVGRHLRYRRDELVAWMAAQVGDGAAHV